MMSNPITLLARGPRAGFRGTPMGVWAASSIALMAALTLAEPAPTLGQPRPRAERVLCSRQRGVCIHADSASAATAAQAALKAAEHALTGLVALGIPPPPRDHRLGGSGELDVYLFGRASGDGGARRAATGAAALRDPRLDTGGLDSVSSFVVAARRSPGARLRPRLGNHAGDRPGEPARPRRCPRRCQPRDALELLGDADRALPRPRSRRRRPRSALPRALARGAPRAIAFPARCFFHGSSTWPTMPHNRARS